MRHRKTTPLEVAERMYPAILDPEESVVMPHLAKAIGVVGRALVGMSEGAVHLAEARMSAEMLEKIAAELRRAADLAEFARSEMWKRQEAARAAARE